MHRTIEIAWMPRTAAEWRVFDAARAEAARLWNDLVVRHARIRRLGYVMSRHGTHVKWPTYTRWCRWVKRRYPGLAAQSAQHVIRDFLGAVRSAMTLRATGDVAAAFPWRKRRFREVIYTNQGARIRDGRLVLPNGTSGHLRVRLPRDLALPGRLMEVHLGFGAVRLVCKTNEATPVDVSGHIGVDLGVNTLIAATDGDRAVCVSGRDVKATTQWRNKRLASLQSMQSHLTKGSRRWRRLQRRKLKMIAKSKNKIRDVVHKATRIIADAFQASKATVGKPFNDAGERLSGKHAQPVSQACNRKIIMQLAYKLAGGVTEVGEAYTSQTCPVCGERRRLGRIYRCECGFVAPRDVVGSTNIRRIGVGGGMVSSLDEIPKRVAFVRPLRKYPGTALGSSQVVPGDPRHVARSVA